MAKKSEAGASKSAGGAARRRRSPRVENTGVESSSAVETGTSAEKAAQGSPARAKRRPEKAGSDALLASADFPVASDGIASEADVGTPEGGTLGSESSSQWAHLERGVREVMGLYERYSRELLFPDVHYLALSEKASELEGLAQASARARAQLESAQKAYDEAERILRSLAKTAFAYASVYARGESAIGKDIHDALQGFAFANPDKPRRRKAMKRKAASEGGQNSELLFPGAKGQEKRAMSTRDLETHAASSNGDSELVAERIVEVEDGAHLHVA